MPPKHNVTTKSQNVAIKLDYSKCIGCNGCVRACNAQSINVYTQNEQKFFPPTIQNGSLDQSDCIFCGQCAVACPVAAITPRDDVECLKKAIAEKKQIIGLVAPSTRYAVGEPFQIIGQNSQKGLVKILKTKFGFEKVFDVNFGADETTIIDTEELLHGMKEGHPVFTSCCPAWVRLAETRYPDLLKYISTAKSCVDMVGHMARKHFKDAFIVELMPCTAKKHELLKHGDINCCVTVNELTQLFKENGITKDDFESDIDFDEPFNVVSGGSHIFGYTGGVGETVLRQACLLKNVETYEIKQEWVEDELKYKKVQIGDLTVTLCVATGGKQIDKAAQLVQKGEMKADIIEQMACPGGCHNGGGMIKIVGQNKNIRREAMDHADRESQFKIAGQNKTLLSETMDEAAIHHAYHTSFGK